MNDAEVKVLVERMNNYLDGQKRIEGQLAMLVQMQLSLASIQEQIKGLDSGQRRLFEKSDEVDAAMKELRENDIQPLRDDMIGNRRAVRAISLVGSIVVTVAGILYSQWKPWAADFEAARQKRDEQMAKFQYDVGTELRRDDNRLTVLEFRANNLDQKATK
ncbi:hypothetical protein CBA19CS91_01860 [Paraburkholderia hospita]|nr:hypothetical protein CBA19CS91_01860 [Paraburkholderia hospita]